MPSMPRPSNDGTHFRTDSATPKVCSPSSTCMTKNSVAGRSRLTIARTTTSTGISRAPAV